MTVLRSTRIIVAVLTLCCLRLPAQDGAIQRMPSFAELNRQANAGDAIAQEQLGTCYLLGFCLGTSDETHITEDDSVAAGWFQKAADKGNALGELDLSSAYRHGHGVAQDNAKALQWLRKAAEAGQVIAQEILGIAYEHGSLGPADPAQALLWLQRAAAQGDLDAKAEVDKLAAFARLDEATKQLEAFLTPQSAQDSSSPVPPPSAPAAVPQPAPVTATPPRGFATELSAGTPAAAAPVAIPHNYALIFATDDYATWPHLTNPISDADAVASTLKALYSFDVDEIRNPTDDQILAKLTEYLHRSFQPQDQLLIFFSGHGYFDPDLRKGFIVPANALLVKDDIGHRSLLAHDTIMNYVNQIPSQHVVLVVDACFAGTLDRRIADGGLRGDPSTDIYAHASLPDLLARKEPKRTRRYITSGGKDFVPDGLPGHHSPFISALLVTFNQGADRKGYLTLDDIQQGLDTVNPEPRWGDIQDDNDPGADFLLLTPTAVAQLSKPN